MKRCLGKTCTANHPTTFSKNLLVIQAYGQVDEDGSRLLLGDYAGGLHLLVLTHDSDRCGLALVG